MTELECSRCLNSTANPTISVVGGLCSICRWYDDAYNQEAIHKERTWFENSVNGTTGSARVVVGISGGKDSTAALFEVRQRTKNVSSFTIRSGYYPAHIETRSAEIADQLSVRHAVFDMRPLIRANDRESYHATADLYSRSDLAAEEVRRLYAENRRHYSVKCNHSMAFVRPCQLCRRTVVRAYFAYATTKKAAIVVLGLNEWAGLSASVMADGHGTVSAIRRLQPASCETPVWVVHLPFLYNWRLGDTEQRLTTIGWMRPPGERLVEGGWNSCGLAAATEATARRLLRFSPDSARLSREITAGFLSRGDAELALGAMRPTQPSVHELLQAAEIL